MSEELTDDEQFDKYLYDEMVKLEETIDEVLATLKEMNKKFSK